MTNKIYDILKWIVIVAMPALTTLYNILATTWEWPYISEITATLTALTAALGTLLGVSSIKYNKGDK